MKAVVRNGHWYFTSNYVYYNSSNRNVLRYIEGLEYDLLRVVLQQMNMTFVHVPTPKSFEIWDVPQTKNLVSGLFGKEIYIALGNVGTNHLGESNIDSTNSFYMLSARWYVPCSVKYPRWSSVFRILTVELWLVLIISIVTASISIHLLGDTVARLSGKGIRH